MMCFLIAAVILLEWHYVADIIAGVFVAALAIAITDGTLRRKDAGLTPLPANAGSGTADEKFPAHRRPVLWLLLSVLSAASMAFYVANIWSANQPPGFSDLYAPWWAAHELFLHHRNPYSPAVAHEIQTVIYGAPVAPSPDDPSGLAGGFAYPPYATLLLWPTVYSPSPSRRKYFCSSSVLAHTVEPRAVAALPSSASRDSAMAHPCALRARAVSLHCKPSSCKT